MPFESTVGESDLVIGQEYFGSTVVRVKQDVTDKDGKYQVKRTVRLKSGHILTETYIREKGDSEINSKEYGLPADHVFDEPKKDDSEARAKARAILAKNKKDKKDKKKKKKKSKPEPAAEMFWEKDDPPPKIKTAPKPSEPKFDIYNVPAKVFPVSELPDTMDVDAPVMGVWKHDDGTDDTNWEPMDVVIQKDLTSDLYGVPHGAVAVKKGVKPDEDGQVDPSDLKFFAPHEKPPAKYQKLGYWKPSELNQKWPPVKPKPRSFRKVKEQPILPDFDGEEATVFPASKCPRKQKKDGPLAGAWKHEDDTDDSDWAPLDVIISKDPPSSLEPDEPQGIVALKKGIVPNRDGKVAPSDLEFFPPDEDPPSNYNKVGHWRPKKSDQVWPPEKLLPVFDEERATIVPKSKMPRKQWKDDPLTGAWEHNDDTDDSKWLPIAVLITQEDPELFLEPGDPHGIIAVEEGVEANKYGKIDPTDVKFFTPGEEPPQNYTKLGHWSPENLDQVWPPVRPKLPDLDIEHATVVPESKMPRSQDEDDSVTGAWKHNDDTDDSDWIPMEVIVTQEDPATFLEPEDPHGIIAVEEGAEPNKYGKIDPSDLKFFTPDEVPPSNYNKVGHWMPEEVDQNWPPVKENLPDYDGEHATVVPASKLPRKHGRDDPLTGAWEHNDNTDDDDWEPMDVVISNEPPSFLEPNEPHGIVAAEKGAQPNSKTGKLDPSALKFFTPDEEPPSNYNKLGHWRPGKLNQDWPPVKPKLPSFNGKRATVVPKSKLPRRLGKNDPLTGAWEHDDDTDDSDWLPMDVIIVDDPPSDEEHHGIVGVEDGAKPNKYGKLDPSALKFFTPGAKLPRKFNKVGHWKPDKLNQNWPPVKPKLKLPSFDGEKATVVPKTKMPRKQGKDDPLTGPWQHNDDTDDRDWNPIDVVISKERPSFLGIDEPHGIVAVEDGVEPNKYGKLDPSDIKFFTPDEEPPSNYNKVGHWRPGKLNQDWPPVKPNYTLPDFNGKSARVVPESKLPKAQDRYGKLTGPWKHNDDTDDTDWEPIDVTITKDVPSDLYPGEPNGVVAVEEGVTPNEDGKLNPNDLKFFTPEEEPPSNYNKVGHWRPGKLNQDWPPVKPDVTLPSFNGDVCRVVPLSRLDEATFKDPPLMGVWKHSDGTDDSDWDPIDCIITKNPPANLDSTDFHGIVAVKEDTKPNKVGKLDPSDLKFFTPGEEPSPNYKKVGHWSPISKAAYPPVKASPGRSLRDVGKLKIPGFDRVPDTGVVFPRRQAPDNHDDKEEQIIAKGVWKWSKPENKPEDSNKWMPSAVQLFENGNEPHDWVDFETHGVFGVNPDVDLDSKMNIKPTDLWFYPPKEEIDEGFEPIGKWRPSKKGERAEWSWPPKPIGKVKATHQFSQFERSPRGVGKLRVPSFFKGK